MKHKDFSYRNLIVWQKAMQFARTVYTLVRRFPAEERFALSDQVRRAVVSIASNIAEGCGRVTKKDYAHFLAIARGSLFETMTQLEMAQQFGYVESITEVESEAAEIGRMLTSLLKKYGVLTPTTTTSHYNSPTPTTTTSHYNSPTPTTTTSHYNSPTSTTTTSHYNFQDTEC